MARQLATRVGSALGLDDFNAVQFEKATLRLNFLNLGERYIPLDSNRHKSVESFFIENLFREFFPKLGFTVQGLVKL